MNGINIEKEEEGIGCIYYSGRYVNTDEYGGEGVDHFDHHHLDHH